MLQDPSKREAGRPLSALLFIAFMQSVFGRLQEKWDGLSKRRKGKQLGLSLCAHSPNLTNLRFADDVILVAQTKSDVIKMLRDLAKYSKPFGLKISFPRLRF